MPKEEKTIEEKIADLEKQMTEKDTEIAQLKATNEDLQKKINVYKIDALNKKVETKVVEENEVEFDFTL